MLMIIELYILFFFYYYCILFKVVLFWLFLRRVLVLFCSSIFIVLYVRLDVVMCNDESLLNLE